jgi:dihydroneopterin aldolase
VALTLDHAGETALDKVFIEGLEVDTLIGAYDWERDIRQCLRLDLCLGWDNRPAAATDDLSKALDYAQVSARIQAFATESTFILVETFAERLAEVLMAEFDIPWLRLKLTKPGAVPAAIGVGVEIERGCL